MYYKYHCVCGKELFAEHDPEETKLICSEIDPECKAEYFVTREDARIQIIKSVEELREEMRHYSTDDQDVLRERISKHLEEINIEKSKENNNLREEISPAEMLEIFKKAQEENK